MIVPTTSLGKREVEARAAPRPLRQRQRCRLPSRPCGCAKILRLLCSVHRDAPCEGLAGKFADNVMSQVHADREKVGLAASAAPGASGTAERDRRRPALPGRAPAAPRSGPSNRRFAVLELGARRRVGGRAALRARAPRRRVASPSRTACISSVSRGVFQGHLTCPQVLEQARAGGCLRLEQPRLHGLLVDVEDLRDLLVAAFARNGAASAPSGRSSTCVISAFAAGAPAAPRSSCRSGSALSPAGECRRRRRALLVAVAAQQVERLVDGDPVDPAEELVFRVVVVEPLGHLEEDGLR